MSPGGVAAPIDWGIMTCWLKFWPLLLSLLLCAPPFLDAPLHATEGETFELPGGVEMAYLDRGSREPALVFVHCRPCRKEIWSETLDAFAPDHRVAELSAPSGGDREEAELEARVESLRKEISAAYEAEGAPEEWRQLQEVEAEIEEERWKTVEELKPLIERSRELRQTEAVRDWKERLEELARQLGEVMERLGDFGAEQGHRQLARSAVAAVPRGRKLGFDPLSYPAVDGSTSTLPLAVVIASKLLGSEYLWEKGGRHSSPWRLRPAIRTADRPPFSLHSPPPPAARWTLVTYRPWAAARVGDREVERRTVFINHLLAVHSGTHGAYGNLIRGETDLALVAREPSEEELALARQQGVELATEVVARDAFVFLVHRTNPVTGLSLEEIRSIYEGEIGNWSQVGGEDRSILPFRRDPQSGSQELMEQLVLEGRKMNTTGVWTPSLIAPGMAGPFLALTREEAGIGFSVHYYARYMIASPLTRLLAVDGVAPAPETIEDGTYPLITRVHLAWRKGPEENGPAARWRHWLLSPEGQAVVRESGYVPVRE